MSPIPFRWDYDTSKLGAVCICTHSNVSAALNVRSKLEYNEKTSIIYLGCFVVTAALTHIMAHTAVAATIYPLLVSIYALYGEGENKTRFGKGLFIGMAYVAGAGSIVTLLGAARGAVALGFYKDIMNVDITFFQLTWYMFPIGWIMTFLLWGFFMVFFKPEKATIPGLREKAKKLNDELGGMTRNEIMAAAIVGICILIMAAKHFSGRFDFTGHYQFSDFGAADAIRNILRCFDPFADNDFIAPLRSK